MGTAPSADACRVCITEQRGARSRRRVPLMLLQQRNGAAGGIRSLYTIGYHSSNPARDGTFLTATIIERRGCRSLRVTSRDGNLAPASSPIAR